MNIIEAILEAKKENVEIARSWWKDSLSIRPTDSPECCIVIDLKNKKPLASRWNPKAEDLTANDWELIKRTE